MKLKNSLGVVLKGNNNRPIINIIIMFDLSNKKILLQSKFNDQLCIGH